METEKNPQAQQAEAEKEAPKTPAQPSAETPVPEAAPDKKSKKKEKKKRTVKEEIISWITTLLGAVIVVMAIRVLIAEPIRVDGASMTNTLQNGEIVLVSKLDYRFGEMQRGDVVICRYPGRTTGGFSLGANVGVQIHELFVKRLVALPGDTIFIVNGALYVNGEQVPDPVNMASVPQDYAPRLLGADEYFVIGDNRLHSHDSRSSDVGPISADAIMGKVKCVLWPLSNIRGVE